jgi:hypothetical protein
MSLLASLFAKKKETQRKGTPACDLRRHVSQPIYYLQSYCQDKHTRIHHNWGHLASFSETDMKSRGLDIVLADLREFPHRDSERRLETSNKTPEGKRDAKAWRESVPVFISLLPDGAIQLTPTAKWSRAAWTHLTDESLTLKQPTTPEAFFQALTTAFDRCMPEGA